MNDKPSTGDRLAKVMARRGLCSRRDAEEWIKAGRVRVNGQLVKTPAFNVVEADTIVVDGAPLEAQQGTRVWLYHKPAGLVVTEKDPEGRPTVFEALEQHGLPRVMSVGRLDINTEGLLLLTNDGGLKRVLELPATGWLRRYRVRAFGKVSQETLDTLKAGIDLEGVKYGPIEAVLEREQGANVWLLVGLREGKNREVKNVLAALGLEVNRLIRVSFGPFQLGDIPVGGVQTVKARVLKDQLGERLSHEAGADFVSDMPVREEEAAPPRRRRAEPGGERPATAPRARPRREPERFAGRPGGGERTRSFGDRPHGAGRRGAAPERATGPVRHIHFEDDRAPEVYEDKSRRPRRGQDDRAAPARGRQRAGGRSAPYAGADGTPRPTRRPKPAGPRGAGPAARSKPSGAAVPPRSRAAKPEAGDRPPKRAGSPKPFTRADGSPSGRRPRSGAGQRAARPVEAAGKSAAGKPAAARPRGGKPSASRRGPSPSGEPPARRKPPAPRPPKA
jgi:23S rRNA pseudouridine2605 synthase